MTLDVLLPNDYMTNERSHVSGPFTEIYLSFDGITCHLSIIYLSFGAVVTMWYSQMKRSTLEA